MMYFPWKKQRGDPCPLKGLTSMSTPDPTMWSFSVHSRKPSLKWASDPWRSIYFQDQGRRWAEWAGGISSSQVQVSKDWGGCANRTLETNWRGSHRPDEEWSESMSGPARREAADAATTAVGQSTANTLKSWVHCSTKKKKRSQLSLQDGYYQKDER